jgi:hypothetical protein
MLQIHHNSVLGILHDALANGGSVTSAVCLASVTHCESIGKGKGKGGFTELGQPHRDEECLVVASVARLGWFISVLVLLFLVPGEGARAVGLITTVKSGVVGGFGIRLWGLLGVFVCILHEC